MSRDMRAAASTIIRGEVAAAMREAW